MTDETEFQRKAINTIRFLSADAIQQANSGHPGLPMGTAPMAFAIWTRHLRHNPANPSWANRDRFVLSGGHGSMLLYSLLHLTGYDLSLEDIKRFRQWDSRTPGHPEFGHTPGVETTTGPLGQGFANGVGMAMAEAHLASIFNRPGHEIINHHVYAIVTDGDLMEGIGSEAASFAGSHKLGKLIYLYDDNHISIEGSTEITFTEDRGMRFEAYGWHVQHVTDGLDVEVIDQAIKNAKNDPRPSIIMVHNIIGYGLPTRAGTAKAHGEPPGDEELDGAKEALGWPKEPRFFIPDDVLTFYRSAKTTGAELEDEWQKKMDGYRQAYPQLASELERRLKGELPSGWADGIPVFSADPKGMATRASSGKVLNSIADRLPELFGGSADLAPSNNTWINSSPVFTHPEENLSDPEREPSFTGRNVHFGVREHAMGGIVNGLAYHGGVIPYGATFLVFSDYMRPSVRLSAFSHIAPIWIYTHDSIGVGEDGPTHQPVEQLGALRAIPNLVTIRPADANETAEAWKNAIENRHRPTALVLTRQNLPTLDRTIYSPASGLKKGAYVLADLGSGTPDMILMASGSEVGLIVEAGKPLAEMGFVIRLVSFPSWELFEQQDADYQNSVLLPEVRKRLAVEAGISMGWHHWTGTEGKILGLERFGASAPGAEIFKKLGFSVENVVHIATEMLK